MYTRSAGYCLFPTPYLLPSSGRHLVPTGVLLRRLEDDLPHLRTVAQLGRLGPLLEHLVLHHADGDRHEGVILAAQLRALAEVDALPGRLEPGCRDAALHGVHLHAEGG